MGTSGTAFQRFEAGGRESTATSSTPGPASPPGRRPSSVTVLAPTAAEADALSTAFYLLGPAACGVQSSPAGPTSGPCSSPGPGPAPRHASWRTWAIRRRLHPPPETGDAPRLTRPHRGVGPARVGRREDETEESPGRRDRYYPGFFGALFLVPSGSRSAGTSCTRGPRRSCRPPREELGPGPDLPGARGAPVLLRGLPPQRHRPARPQVPRPDPRRRQPPQARPRPPRRRLVAPTARVADHYRLRRGAEGRGDRGPPGPSEGRRGLVPVAREPREGQEVPRRPRRGSRPSRPTPQGALESRSSTPGRTASRSRPTARAWSRRSTPGPPPSATAWSSWPRPNSAEAAGPYAPSPTEI